MVIIKYVLLKYAVVNLYSCGRNDHGQLGIDDDSVENINTPQHIKMLENIESICVGYVQCLCIDVNHNLFVFGCNTDGKCGSAHSICIDKKGILYGFGYNSFGQLYQNHLRIRNL